MIEDYRSAQRAGQRAYRANVARGQSPYLAVLDDILTDVDIVAQEPLGLVDIPAESIVGTKTAGCHTAFASNFMPLLDDDTEFAVKWSNLCDAHLEEGIHTPIIAFEYLNKFYVQEGNKRVSVLKYYEAVKIPGTVTRLIPAKNDTLENKLYYEFLDFYKFSRINYVSFSRLGGYAKLQTLACKATGEAWTDDDRLNFSSLYTMFSQQFYALGGGSLGLTPGDALLVYLSVYRYAAACASTPTKVRENLARLWDEVKILAEPHAVELLLEPKQSSEPLLSKLNIFSSRPSELRVVFLHEHNAQTSAWVRGQDKGRAALVKAFPDKLYVSCRENINPEVDAEQVLEEVAHDHADIVFTTSARMHTACLKVAAQHPKTRFLNCSLSAPHPLVRTYYPRTYEVTYLLGMLAGIVSHSDKVGYVAANPVYGVPAAINAFALGAQLTNPRAEIELRWSCCEASPAARLAEEGLRVICARDLPGSGDSPDWRGLCLAQNAGPVCAALPVWNWGEVYIRLARSILRGGWDELSAVAAVNYWWGFASGAVDVQRRESLPDGPRELVRLLRAALTHGELAPFHRRIADQTGAVQNDGERWLAPEEVLHMDWLCANVRGSIPQYDELLPMARPMVRLLGLYRETLQPEKRGPLL